MLDESSHYIRFNFVELRLQCTIVISEAIFFIIFLWLALFQKKVSIIFIYTLFSILILKESIENFNLLNKLQYDGFSGLNIIDTLLTQNLTFEMKFVIVIIMIQVIKLLFFLRFFSSYSRDKLKISLIIIVISLNISPANSKENSIIKISPTKINKLPSSIINYLNQRKCTVPQTFNYSERNIDNIIQGEFFEKGQKDWAVLCSVNGFSSILIFPDSSIIGVKEIARENDNNFFQNFGNNSIGYSRKILPTEKLYIMERNKSVKFTIIHEGIEDIYFMKIG